MDPLSNKWLIIGLGNPGSMYERTRHNLGFMLVDRLAEQAGILVKRNECRALIGQGRIEGEPVELVKPQTFMNLSGEAAGCLMAKPDRAVEKTIVISDDLALPIGSIRLRPKGSHGGHNGLRSLIDCLKTSEFIRLRIGILPEHPVANTKNFVLENFTKGEAGDLDKILERGVDAIKAVITVGIDKAMAEFN